MILEAHANLALRMGCDGQPGFAIDTLLVKIHVLFWTRVDDLNVDALVGARCDVRGDDHKRIYVGRIPNAFCWWVALCREGEFDGICGACEEEDGEECEKHLCWSSWEHGMDVVVVAVITKEMYTRRIEGKTRQPGSLLGRWFAVRCEDVSKCEARRVWEYLDLFGCSMYTQSPRDIQKRILLKKISLMLWNRLPRACIGGSHTQEPATMRRLST